MTIVPRDCCTRQSRALFRIVRNFPAHIVFLILLFTTAAPSQQLTGSFLVQEGTRRINGVRLYYKTMGRGDPVVIVHGGPGMDHAYFLPHLNRLASSHKLIFFDQRASGRSSVPKDTNAMALGRFVDDIEGIRKAFGLQHMNLLAHSWGSILALRYALKYPDHLKSLILVTPVAASSSDFRRASEALSRRMTKKDSIAIARMEKTDRFRRRTPGAMEDWFRLYIPSLVYKREDAGKIFLNFPRDYWAKSKMLQYLGPEASRFDLYPELPSINVPTLIVGAEADATPLESLERMRDAIPGAQLVTIMKSGHFPFAERPDEFFPVVLRFLRLSR